MDYVVGAIIFNRKGIGFIRAIGQLITIATAIGNRPIINIA